jgi:hypothetical protein
MMYLWLVKECYIGISIEKGMYHSLHNVQLKVHL